MIETVLFEYLLGVFNDVPVFMEIPESGIPPRFILLEKTGGGFENQIGYATFAAQSYGASLADAATLNQRVIRAMLDAVILDEVSQVDLNSDYNFTDTTRKRHRYQAVFDITHYVTP